MQRRAGNKIFWEMISFTGTFAPEFLRQALQRRSDGAGQPAALVNPTAKASAYEARARYRLGKKFAGIRTRDGPQALRHWQRDLADRFDSGELREAVNATTRAHGHGRLRTIVAFPRQRPQDPPNRPQNNPKHPQTLPGPPQNPPPAHPGNDPLFGKDPFIF